MTNSRVTNAQLAVKIDKLTENVHAYKLTQEKRIVYLETCMEITKGDVDTLKKRDYIVGGIGGVLATIAAVVGINK